MPTYGVKLKIGLRNVAIGEGTNGLRAVIHTQLDSGNYLEIAQTETQFHSRDPDFVQRVSLQYRFDRVCRIKTEVYAVRDATSEALEYKIGEAIVDLPVLLANASHLCLPINEYQAFVDLQLEVPDFYKHTAQMRFVASHLHAPSQCPSIAAYYVLLLVLEKRTIMLYKSEVIPSKNPEWQQFSIPLYIVQFYQQASLQIHVYNYNPNHEDVLIGQVSTIWTQLQRGPGPLNSYMLLNHEGRRKDEKMSLDLLLLEQGQGVSFFDMVSQNLRIHLGVAVDFTASNGDPTQPESLHYIHPHRPNSYISVMLKQLPPVLGHSKDIRITAIGFGAKVGPNHQLSHCFSLDSNSLDFHVNGFEGLLNAYRRARLEVMPFAPTEFADAIYHMSKFAKASTRLKMGMYFILLILTDGDITNAKATRDALADACDAPLSVIAIGLGEEKSFDKIRSLESPSMKHSDGRLISRQVLSFVRSVDVEEDDAVALLPFRMQQWNLLNLNKTTS